MGVLTDKDCSTTGEGATRALNLDFHMINTLRANTNELSPEMLQNYTMLFNKNADGTGTFTWDPVPVEKTLKEVGLPAPAASR